MRETIDLMSIAVADGDLSARDEFDLMQQMADRDWYLDSRSRRRTPTLKFASLFSEAEIDIARGAARPSWISSRLIGRPTFISAFAAMPQRISSLTS